MNKGKISAELGPGAPPRPGGQTDGEGTGGAYSAAALAMALSQQAAAFAPGSGTCDIWVHQESGRGDGVLQRAPRGLCV